MLASIKKKGGILTHPLFSFHIPILLINNDLHYKKANKTIQKSNCFQPLAKSPHISIKIKIINHIQTNLLLSSSEAKNGKNSRFRNFLLEKPPLLLKIYKTRSIGCLA